MYNTFFKRKSNQKTSNDMPDKFEDIHSNLTSKSKKVKISSKNHSLRREFENNNIYFDNANFNQVRKELNFEDMPQINIQNIRNSDPPCDSTNFDKTSQFEVSTQNTNQPSDFNYQ